MDIFLQNLLWSSGIVALFYAGYKIFRLTMQYLANRKRMLNLVFLRVLIPKKESKEDVDKEQAATGKDWKEAVGVGAHLFEALHSIYSKNLKKHFIGQDYISLEYAVIESMLNFYVVVPQGLRSMIDKQITSFYPDAYIEQVPDYNIFKPNSKIAATYLKLSKEFYYPIKNYERLNSDPLNNITNVLSKVAFDDGVAIQIMIRPVRDGWQKAGREEAKNIFKDKKKTRVQIFNPLSLIKFMFDFLVRGDLGKGKSSPEAGARTTPITDEEVKAMENKCTRVGYETVIRIVTSAQSEREAGAYMQSITAAFAQFKSPSANGFSKMKYLSEATIAKDFIFRNFRRTFREFIHGTKNILSADEVASVFHFPNVRYNRAPTIAWQNFKIATPPANIPKEGILLGHNSYRGEVKEIRMKREDRFRHFYVIGQTGTGKSSVFQVMIRQDLQNGDGIAVIDPHGSLIEDILPFIPRSRADDVIYFNPADMERPMGMNLLEGNSDEEKEYVALEAMNIMIKLFNEEIFGPRIQDYFRNGCLTLMADPEGGALTDIVRLFTDDDYQRLKVEHVKNPIVRSFWENQMAKTGAREKQEMIPYFAAKFGQFVTNTMMRNIIGQARSAFDFAKIMSEKKILLINLSKGDVGEINSRLLGLIIVSKIQMAALARQKMPKHLRSDFFLYIDEFQNYITDSIEVILSEARKYRLGMNMAHQYIAQLEGADGKSKVKAAVFGNVGSMMVYKIGAQDAEYMAKEMAPVFSDQDLINLDKFKAVMKLSIDTQPSRPFSITPVNPYLEKGDYEAAEAYKQLSRLKYGRDREFVDREILRRIGAIM